MTPRERLNYARPRLGRRQAAHTVPKWLWLLVACTVAMITGIGVTDFVLKYGR